MDGARDAGLQNRQVIEPKNGCLSIDDIKKILPHRYPFLFVDKVIEIEDGKRAVGIRNVMADELYFAGHFPGNPIMPGVLIVEALAQVAGILMLNKEENLNRPAYFIGLDAVRFRKAVIPGDVLRLEVEILKQRTKIVQMKCEAKVHGDIVCEAQMLFGRGV